MVIDTSAIYAAIADELDAEVYRSAIKRARLRLVSSVTLLETRIVLFARLGPDAIVTLDELIERVGIVIVPFDGELSQAAFDAFRKYGKGQGGPAQLNIVDCAAMLWPIRATFLCCSRGRTSPRPTYCLHCREIERFLKRLEHQDLDYSAS